MPRLLALLMGVILPLTLLAKENPGVCGVIGLTFTMVPKKDIDEQLQEFQPLMSLLSDELGVPVELIRASSY